MGVMAGTYNKVKMGDNPLVTTPFWFKIKRFGFLFSLIDMSVFFNLFLEFGVRITTEIKNYKRNKSDTKACRFGDTSFFMYTGVQTK